MIRSLNTGVLGIRTFQTSLDAIGNNLANINTVAYKSARVDFADTLNQTLRAPTPDTEGSTGTTGMQVGNGLSITAIKNSFTQGAVKQTGVRTDLAIAGEGFFLVKDPTTNELFGTRAGDFRTDKNGFLVTNGGHRVQGMNQLAPAYSVNEQKSIGDIQLDEGKYMNEVAGVSVKVDTDGDDILQFSASDSLITGQQVKFSILPEAAGEGASATSPPITTSSVLYVRTITGDTTRFTLHPTASDAAAGTNSVNFDGSTVASNSWTLTKPGKTLDLGAIQNSVALYLQAGNWQKTEPTAGSGAYETYAANTLINIDQKSAIQAVDVGAAVVAPGTYIEEPSAGSASLSKDIELTDYTTRLAGDYVTVDPTTSHGTNITVQDSAATAATNLISDLNMVGGASISSFNVGADGMINMLLTDGTQYSRGQVRMQNFLNTQNLMKQGSNLYSNLGTAGPLGTAGSSASATQMLAGAEAPGNAGLGRIESGALELSNVDMAREFATMITTQRAFQANARMITTSDEILQEMMQLKR